MKKLLSMFAMLISMNVVAAQSNTATIDVSSLTDEQRAQIATIVAQKKAEAPAQVVDQVMDRVEQFAASAARGVVGFAKELGTEANNFAQTPLGMVVAGFTVLHFFGHEITSLIVGVLFLFILSPILFTLFIRSFKTVDYTYENKPTLFGAFNKRYVVEVSKRNMTDAEQIKTFVLGVMTCIAIGVGGGNFVI